jgi:hypothetical protein
MARKIESWKSQRTIVLTSVRDGTTRSTASPISPNAISVTVNHSGAPCLVILGLIPCAFVVGDIVENEWQCAGLAWVCTPISQASSFCEHLYTI